jgi:hypothetical protein
MSTVSTAAFRSVLEYVLQHLGRETLIKWYSEYQRKYAALQLRVVCERPDDAEATA